MRLPEHKRPAGSLGLICGGGRLPLELAAHLFETGQDCRIIAIEKEARAELGKWDAHFVPITQIGQIVSVLRNSGCTDVLLLGSIGSRPDISQFFSHAGNWRFAHRLVAALRGGDNRILMRLIALLESEKLNVRAPGDFMPHMLAGYGLLAGPPPDRTARADMAIAIDALAAMGQLDIGQGAICLGARIIAVEAAEGTDEMLARCAGLRKRGKISTRPGTGVLVKAVKSGQDRRVDLPTIGPATVELAAQAGLAGIAVEAGGCLVAQRRKMIEEAGRLGLFILGYNAPVPAN